MGPQRAVGGRVFLFRVVRKRGAEEIAKDQAAEPRHDFSRVFPRVMFLKPAEQIVHRQGRNRFGGQTVQP
jgi:hypothetical protein